MKTIIAQGRICPGEVDYNKSGRKNCKVVFLWELREGENGPEFSAQAEIWNPRQTDIYLGGQCLEEVAAFFRGNWRVQRLLAIWREWHLNGMTAGLPEQEQAVKEWEAAGNRYDFTAACDMLKARGLYELPVPAGAACTGDWPEAVKSGARGYQYGERWIHRPLPAEIVEELQGWVSEPKAA